jgi:hypothetical protein
MSFLAQVAAYLLQWLLKLGGEYLYNKSKELVDREAQRKQEKENLKRYQEAVKKGDDDKTLEAERDLINNSPH